MAGGALFRRGLVEQDGFAVDLMHQLVAIGAFHIRVHTLKRERRAPIVVEVRGPPFVAVVAVGAGSDVRFCELFTVRILVALLTCLWRGLEVHVHHRGFEIRRLVAIDARGGAMCTYQRKSRLRVIKLGELFPRLGGVARLAPARVGCRFCLLHALIELPIVRIGVTTGATQICPVINSCGRLQFGGLLVAIRTRHRNVLASQEEARFSVLLQRKRRWPIRFNCVATFTRTEIRRCCELAGVLVFMTVGAVVKLHFEYRVDAARNVALFASNFGVRALQRICSCDVICDRKRRGLPALNRVASAAFAAIGTFCELSLVGIGLVTIGAFFKRNWLLEVATAVTLNAADGHVFSQQRKLGFGMVEFLV